MTLPIFFGKNYPQPTEISQLLKQYGTGDIDPRLERYYNSRAMPIFWGGRNNYSDALANAIKTGTWDPRFTVPEQENTSYKEPTNPWLKMIWGMQNRMGHEEIPPFLQKFQQRQDQRMTNLIDPNHDGDLSDGILASIRANYLSANPVATSADTNYGTTSQTGGEAMGQKQYANGGQVEGRPSVKQAIMSVVAGNPQLQQNIQQAVTEMQNDPDVTPDVVAEMIRLFELSLQNPDVYTKVRQMAIQMGALDETDLPPQYDPSIVSIILAALYTLQDNLQQNYKKGGLAAMGRRGDNMLAHINPVEASILKAYGGSGTINPRTGLPEFGFLSKLWKGVKSVVKAVAPIAAFFVPVIGPALGAALGMTGTMASIVGSALAGAGISALGGGNPLQGAIMGGLGAGGSEWLGNTISGATGLSQGASQVVGNALVGGVAGTATGQSFGKGALTGAAGTYLGQQLSGLAGTNAGPLGSGLTAAGKAIGNLSASGLPLSQAVIGGALSGVTAGTLKGLGLSGPGNTQADKLAAQTSGTFTPEELGVGQATGNTDAWQGATQADKIAAQNVGIEGAPTAGETMAGKTSTGLSGTGIGMNMPTATTALALASALSGANTPQQVQQAISQDPQLQHYMNDLKLQSWDWNTLQEQAKAAGVGLGAYVANNWDDITKSTAYSSGQDQAPAQPTVQMAAGGPLARLAMGGGSGRDDTIAARLSDGEYVIDAETVALLGDGSTQEGARRLDMMRRNLRKQKGKALARGKISPNAKSPLNYLKGVA